MLCDDVGVNKKLSAFALDFPRVPVPLCENGFSFCFGVPGWGLRSTGDYLSTPLFRSQFSILPSTLTGWLKRNMQKC